MNSTFESDTSQSEAARETVFDPAARQGRVVRQSVALCELLRRCVASVRVCDVRDLTAFTVRPTDMISDVARVS